MVDVADSKSADGDIVWVRVPPPAPLRTEPRTLVVRGFWLFMQVWKPPSLITLCNLYSVANTWIAVFYYGLLRNYYDRPS